MIRLGLRLRPGLLVALGVFAVAAAASSLGLRAAPRDALLVAWCAASFTHAALLARHLAVTPPGRMRDHAAALEDSSLTVLALTLAAILAALFGVVTELGGAHHAPRAVVLGVATMTLSWIYLHLVFASHYALAYWLSGGGLEFPGEQRPDWLEFVYLAFTVGMTAQVSDVTTSSRRMRRIVLLHALAAFTFNAAIIGVAVNLLAGRAEG